MSARSLAAWAFAATVTLAPAAFAQDKAMASQLFDDAEKLVAAGKLDAACPKYAESERLDPQLGTLLHLADCYEQAGRTASAWASFKDAEEIAGQRGDPRRSKIQESIAEVERKLPRILVNVSPSAPASVEVRRDGEVLGKALWGSPAPIDPGVHQIVASAPGYTTWSQTVTVPATSATLDVAIPDLVPLAPTAPPPAPAAAAPPPAAVSAPFSAVLPPPPPTPASSEGEHPGSSSGQRILGWTALAGGAIGLGIGVVFELQRSSKIKDRDAICPSGLGCTQHDQDQINSITGEARSASTIGTIGLVAGGVLAASGLVLVLTAPSGESAHGRLAIAPAVAPGFQGVVAVGSL